MPETQLSTSVNQHYLNKVIDLSESMDIQANEDIFDARGNKLLAKGARVSPALQEKLIVHKLTKPIEACLSVEGGVDSQRVIATAQRLLNTDGPLARLVHHSGNSGSSPLGLLANLKFGSAMSMMLTIADKGHALALDHAVTVCLLAVAIARRAGLGELDQRVAGMAGLLHDVGELYVDPSYLMPGKRLLPHEWAHVVVHPHTGQILINELDKFPPAVGRAVAEHHERFDGGGYPRRLQGGVDISVPGQLVGLAEMLSGIFTRDQAFGRMALALKIIPNEHPKTLVQALSMMATEGEQGAKAPAVRTSTDLSEEASRLIRRIQLATERTQIVIESRAAKSARARDILGIIVARLKNIERAVASTGLDMLASLGEADFQADPSLLFERDVATREIQWRLRDIARDLAIQLTSSEERLLAVPIITVLDDDFSNAAY